MTGINVQGTYLNKKQYSQLLRLEETRSDVGENRTTFMSLERRGLVRKDYRWLELPQGRRQLRISVVLTDFGRRVVEDLRARGYRGSGERVKIRKNPANTREISTNQMR